MSRGSTFVFLKKTDIPVTDEDIVSKYPEDCLRKTPITIDDLHRYTYFNKQYYADKEQHVLLSTMFDVTFCSTFTCLKEEFDLNPYSTSHDKIVFNETQVRAMLQAIHYLYNEDYSSKTEEMLDNAYIRIFSELHTPYMMYLHPDWEDDCTDDGKWHLRRLRRLLEAYLCMCEEDDENEYVLLYYAWG